MLWRRMDTWTEAIKDEMFLESTELKNYDSADDAEADLGRGLDELEAEGPLPDVMLR